MSNLEKLGNKCCNYFKMLEQVSYGDDHPIKVLLSQYDAEHPGLNSFELKAVQYEILAENIDVVVFEETPFYFINNITLCPGLLGNSCADWLHRRNYHIYEEADPETWRKFNKQQRLRVFLCCGPYTDNVHYTVPVENIVKYGMKKYYSDAEKAKIGATKEELDFLNCAQRGLLAAKRICERYATAAEEKLKNITDSKLRKNMDMLIASAKHAPWEAPKTFFEGLNTCWFARNVLGAMEGVGNSTLGRVDYILYDLYKTDIENGNLTKDEAYELIKQFMLLGDMQYDKDTIVKSGNDHELEMGICIGGCDTEGNPVYNELTSMFIKAQYEMKCIFPKIHARFGSNSPKEYLEELSHGFANGHSAIGLSCDDGIIPGLLQAGKTIEDARNYETVGCWENKVANKESMAGGNYVYAVTILEQSVYGPEQEYIDAGVNCIPLEDAQCFEDVYKILSKNLINVIRWRCESIGKYGKLAWKVNPLCVTSIMRDGSLESRKDYTQGGSVYNPNSCDVAGFANYVDTMLVIKKLCFDEKVISLKGFLETVRNNWQNNDELLYKVRHCPHFGDNEKESNELSQRLHRDLYHALDGIENEHGGSFFLNYYVYREFFQKAKEMRATPDGRRNGDMFAQGIGPSKYHPADSLADIVQSVCCLDTEKCVTSSLDIQLPFGKTTKEQLAVLLRAFAKLRIKHLQINCVSLDALKDAQIHPENYHDLIVRVTGFSAKFVSLSPEFQEEIIKRHIHGE